MPHDHHRCECEHDRVRYCRRCQVVHCLDCKVEWVSHPTPISWPYYRYYWVDPIYSMSQQLGNLQRQPLDITPQITCEHNS